MSEQVSSAVRSFLTGKWILTLATLLLFSHDCVAHPADVTSDQLNTANQMLKKAITDAGERLERQNCSELLGVDAAEALKLTDFRILSLGAPRLKEGRLTVVAARTSEDHRTIVINRDGPFVSRWVLVGGRMRYFSSREAAMKRLSDGEFRTLVVLHELGHVVGRFGPDAGSVDESQHHTDEVIQYCFDSGDAIQASSRAVVNQT